MSPRQLMHATHYGKANPNQTPPIKPSAPEEEISLLLGTLQVPRGRSASSGGILKGGVQGLQGHHRDLNRSKSTVDHVTAARHKDSTGYVVHHTSCSPTWEIPIRNCVTFTYLQTE